MKNIEGLHVINKPLGISSQKAVQIVKWWARRKTGNKKIKVGHGGTLDPLAYGVLVVAVGKEYTKKIADVVGAEKEYIAEITLGHTSSTDDAEGEKILVDDHTVPSEERVRKVLDNFIGHITQVPPQFSAIKIDGQEAYKRVRRGEDPVMEERTVHIKKIEVISYQYPVIRSRVVCGKGTYIRSLARDIGESLGTGAYLSSLVRTRVGVFNIEEAQDIEQYRLRIAIHAAELDQERIDGTRVYIKEMLDRIGEKAQDDRFSIYHKDLFNKELMPPQRDNYTIKRLCSLPLWTQTCFAWEIMKEHPNVIWMPLHNVPLVRPRDSRTIVTIHDLAFHRFPETFPARDRAKLRTLTHRAVKHADHIIAVSESTKNDLLSQYSRHLTGDDVSVVYHGVDVSRWEKRSDPRRCAQIMGLYGVNEEDYIIHVGALQPRKNLIRLIGSFEKVKKHHKSLKLVLAGGRGWLWEEIEERAKQSVVAQDIVLTGNIPFEHVRVLMQYARAFVFPSLYEGFGLPGLEALAAGVPVVAADNSSLTEVLGTCAQYFDPYDTDSMTDAMRRILENSDVRQEMIEKGRDHVNTFTWDKSVKETLRVLRMIR